MFSSEMEVLLANGCSIWQGSANQRAAGQLLQEVTDPMDAVECPRWSSSSPVDGQVLEVFLPIWWRSTSASQQLFHGHTSIHLLLLTFRSNGSKKGPKWPEAVGQSDLKVVGQSGLQEKTQVIPEYRKRADAKGLSKKVHEDLEVVPSSGRRKTALEQTAPLPM